MFLMKNYFVLKKSDNNADYAVPLPGDAVTGWINHGCQHYRRSF